MSHKHNGVLTPFFEHKHFFTPNLTNVSRHIINPHNFSVTLIWDHWGPVNLTTLDVLLLEFRAFQSTIKERNYVFACQVFWREKILWATRYVMAGTLAQSIHVHGTLIFIDFQLPKLAVLFNMLC